MTVIEIISAAQFYTEETYDNQSWIALINAALDDLTPVAKLLKIKEEINLTVTNGRAEIDLSSDPDLSKVHEVVHVYYSADGGNLEQLRRIPISDNVSKGWKMEHDKIILQNIGNPTSATARIDYYKKLDHVTGINETPELPEQYHNLIVLYICAKSQQKEEELDDKNDFYSEYLVAKQQFALERIWQMEPQNRKLIRRLKILSYLGSPTS